MPTRSTRHRIQRYQGKGVCSCFHVGGLFCCCLCRVFLCLSGFNCARKRARAWLPTCVRRHFAVFMEIRLNRLTFSIAFSSVMEGNTHHKYWRRCSSLASGVRREWWRLVRKHQHRDSLKQRMFVVAHRTFVFPKCTYCAAWPGRKNNRELKFFVLKFFDE